MDIRNKLKALEQIFTMNKDSFSKVDRVDNMSEEEINKEYSKIIADRKEVFGLTTDAELKDFSKAMEQFQKLYDAGKPQEANRYIAKYENALIIKKRMAGK